MCSLSFYPFKRIFRRASFKFWLSTVYLFFFGGSFLWYVMSRKSSRSPRCTRFSPMLSCKSCYSFTYKCMIHFEFIFMWDVRLGWGSFSWLWVVSCSSTIGWKGYPSCVEFCLENLILWMKSGILEFLGIFDIISYMVKQLNCREVECGRPVVVCFLGQSGNLNLYHLTPFLGTYSF